MSDWHKSSYSTGAQNCVEVVEGPHTLLRDTQNPELGQLAVPSTEWSALLSAVSAK